MEEWKPQESHHIELLKVLNEEVDESNWILLNCERELKYFGVFEKVDQIKNLYLSIIAIIEIKACIEKIPLNR